MARHVHYSSGTKHERRITDILAQQKRSEGAFLRNQSVAAGMCDGERCAREQTRFADLRADNQPDTGTACSFAYLQRPKSPPILDTRRLISHRAGAPPSSASCGIRTKLSSTMI